MEVWLSWFKAAVLKIVDRGNSVRGFESHHFHEPVTQTGSVNRET